VRKLILEADITRIGQDTKIVIRLMGDGLSREVQSGDIYIILRGYNKFKERSLFDGLMFMFIFVAMRNYDIFEIRGAISRKAIRNVRLFQEAWTCMVPHLYSICEVRPSKIAAPSLLTGLKRDSAISAFSGGLDATFSAVRHTKKDDWSYPLKSCVMVHGFDVSFEDDETYERLSHRVLPLLQSTDLKCHHVKTNIRSFELQNWEHSFASQLAGVLHLFYQSHTSAIIGSSEPYNNLVIPWGSTPATDYLLSGDGLEIIHDGAGYSRTEKAELVALHTVALSTLKVCWQGPDQASNCGFCEKCVRTRLNFKAVGLDNLPCFDTQFEDSMIDKIEVGNIAQLTELITISEFCHRRGVRESWVGRLDRKIEQVRRNS